MASVLPVILTLLLSSPSSSLSTHPNPSSPLPPSNLITSTCNATTYYDFCVSSLSSSSSNATSVKSLSTVLISLAIANATNTSSFAFSRSKSTSKNPTLSSLYRACAEKYTHARESLQSSLDEISNEEYDYAFVHVSAGAEYANVCRVLFRRTNGTVVVYPVEMAKREEVLERLCAVTLDVISLLG